MTMDSVADVQVADQPKPKVFISYSRDDIAFVDRLEPALRACGMEPLIDRSEIYAFEDWWKRIEALIVQADAVVFVLSAESVSSDICRKEVDFAASLNKRFAPIVARPVNAQTVPEPLRRLNFIFFDDAARFEESVGKLTTALETDIVWIRKHTEFGDLAQRWVAAGRRNLRGLLLHSPVLEESERWIAARPRGAPSPTQETQAFIAESRRAATRRRNYPDRRFGGRACHGARARRTRLLAARHRNRAARSCGATEQAGETATQRCGGAAPHCREERGASETGT
jgi:hypothetical protein